MKSGRPSLVTCNRIIGDSDTTLSASRSTATDRGSREPTGGTTTTCADVVINNKIIFVFSSSRLLVVFISLASSCLLVTKLETSPRAVGPGDAIDAG